MYELKCGNTIEIYNSFYRYRGSVPSLHLNTLLAADCPGLWMVETVNKWKTAHVLDRHWGLGERGEPLRVLVQVNTSGEPSQYMSSTLHVHATDVLEGWFGSKCPYFFSGTRSIIESLGAE